MTKRFFTVFSVTLAVIMLSFAAVTSAPVKKAQVESSEITERRVITVAHSAENAPDGAKILESRFLNMLNHNFVYDEAIETVEDIVNNSVIALLDLRDSEDDSYIKESFVADYVFNMYGIELDDFSGINADFPKKDGYVYILPRGYSEFSHEIISVTENEDGSYTVKTKIAVSSHDSGIHLDVCETLFVKNEASQFGFNIIYSNIGGETSAA